MRDPRLPYSFNDFEIVQESEEGNRIGRRLSYLLDGEEVVWSSAYQTYVRQVDLCNRGFPAFELEDAPYLIEHPTHSKRRCLYCEDRMGAVPTFHQATFHEEKAAFFGAKSTEQNARFERYLYECHTCGWWFLHMGFSDSSDDDHAWFVNESIYSQGVLRNFGVSAPDAALEDLVSWLKRRGDSISDIDPFRFEDLIAQFLSERFGKAKVRKVGGRQDRGIDVVIAETDDEPIFVQVKRRTKLNRKESVATVRALNGVLLRERSPFGMVITTSRAFSPAAIREAEEVRRNYVEGPFSRHRVELVDGSGVLEMVKRSRIDGDVRERHREALEMGQWRKSVGFNLHPSFRRLV